MRVALTVGIDDYQNAELGNLSGCVNDASEIAAVMRTNQDGSPNFTAYKLLSSRTTVTRPVLRENLERLFSAPAEVAFFYFAGHGDISSLGGYLITQDAARYDEGVAMSDVLMLAHKSKCREVVIMLDCCHSGAFGTLPGLSGDHAYLREGISILVATRDFEAAEELNGRGLFTGLALEALQGGAADLLGAVTTAGIFSFVDRHMGPWSQRPLFRCNVMQFMPLRRCDPQIQLSILRLLPKHFPTPDHHFPLDPSYEPAAEGPMREEFLAIRAYRAAGLVRPVGHEHMYFAMLAGASCELTVLGKYYWKLTNQQLI